ARRRASARRARSPTSDGCRARRAAPAAPTGASTGCGRSACTTYAAEKRAGGVLRARNRVGGGEGPLTGDAGERERSHVVGEVGNRRVGVEHDPAVVGRERVLGDEVCKQRVRGEAGREPRRGDDLL